MICPITSYRDTEYEQHCKVRCAKEECAWWHGYEGKGMCAVTSLASWHRALFELLQDEYWEKYKNE